jgi:hypothetical protein
MRRASLVLALGLCAVTVWAKPQTQRVTLRAYINVSSGCQAPTVNFLNDLKSRYSPNVSLEMIDFGDQGRGFKRWQQSGYRCLTLELNGSPLVKFPYQGKTVAVAFRMPVGFNWTHADLDHAVQAGVRGELQRATETEVAANARPVKLNVTLAWAPVKQKGRRYSAVLINGNQAILIPVSQRQALADQRAKAAAAVLRAWLAKPFELTALAVASSGTRWKALAAGNRVITATAADGHAYNLSPRGVAEAWMSGIKHALAAHAQ